MKTQTQNTIHRDDEIARMMTDPATCDVLSEDWLKDAIDSLLAQVRALRSENAKLRKLTTPLDPQSVVQKPSLS